MKLHAILIFTAISYALASKLISLPFKGVERTNLRASASQGKGLVDAPLENIDLAYLIDIQLGTPPQPFTLLLDTGSSSTWVPHFECGRNCGWPYNSFTPSNSSTFKSNNALFSIRYGVGFARGHYAQDTLTINEVEVPDVNFAVSKANDGELTADGADGILGIGPDRLSIYNNADRKIYPNLVTTMYEKGLIDHNVFSVYFQPIANNIPTSKREQKRINGEIVFGGVEDRHITSNVTYVPITSNSDFRDYWAVDIQSISVGDYTKTYKKGISAMVDTGSTLVFLPKDIVNRVFKDVKGLRKDFSGQYIVPCKAKNLPSITFTMNNSNYTLAPEYYVITTGVLKYTNEYCYTYLQESPSFVDAILGYGFLQQFVSVYDSEKKSIGFADRA
ncbi:unnamed protein product [Mucor hiemalis]